MDKSLIIALLLLPSVALAQTHTMPGSNVVPSGASLTINSGGSITAAAGSTVTGFGGGAVSITATSPIVVTPSPLVGTGVISITSPLSATFMPAFTGDVTTSAGAVATTIGSGKVTYAKIQNVSANSKLLGSSATGSGAPPSEITLGTNLSMSGSTLSSTGGGATIASTSDVLKGDGAGNGVALGAATAGKIVQSNGTLAAYSTPTWPTTAGGAGYEVRSNGTNIVTYPDGLSDGSTATVSAGYAADTYLAGSSVTVVAGDWKVNGQYHCIFDMVKTGAGVVAIIINVRMGTAGTTADASVAAITFTVQTAVIDSGTFDVWVNFHSVGSGTSAVVQATSRCLHHQAGTGLCSTPSMEIQTVTGAGFNSTTPTILGLSVNGGASFSGTNTIVQAFLKQP